jgi:hypothetical protein
MNHDISPEVAQSLLNRAGKSQQGIRVPGNQVGIDSYREAGYQFTRISGENKQEKVFDPDALIT